MSDRSSTARTSLPNFLIIGAMKSGTTTLYRDLYAFPEIFLPEEKEPENLASDRVYEPAGLKDYARLFAAAGDDAIKGEASTAYTKHPIVKDCARRAKDLLGKELRLVYLVRDPIQRTISHLKHDLVEGAITEDFASALRAHERFITYSDYPRQLAVWLEHFPLSQIRVVKFEDYLANREAEVAAIAQFLGAQQPPTTPTDDRFNASEGRLQLSGVWRKLTRPGSLYSKYVRPLIPWQLRQRAAKLLLQPYAGGFPELAPDDLAQLAEALAHVPEGLAAITNGDYADWRQHIYRLRSGLGEQPLVDPFGAV